MSAKRFIQLFICYAISMIVAILLTDLFNFSSPIAYLVVASIIGYVVITVPLTIMTLLKIKLIKKLSDFNHLNCSIFYFHNIFHLFFIFIDRIVVIVRKLYIIKKVIFILFFQLKENPMSETQQTTLKTIKLAPYYDVSLRGAIGAGLLKEVAKQLVLLVLLF